MDERSTRVSDLLHEAAETHHQELLRHFNPG
jgi:hypothetical protein